MSTPLISIFPLSAGYSPITVLYKVDFPEPLGPRITVIPFVDILLVILIIFKVAAPLAQKALDVKLSKADSGANVTKARVTVSITSTGDVAINGKATPVDELEMRISELVLKNTEIHGKVIFRGLKKGIVEKDASSHLGQGVENGDVCDA